MSRMFLVLSCLAAASPGAAAVFHVDADAQGANDGSSWTDAFPHLQDALAAAGRGDEIRVAAGTYRPDLGAAQTLGDRHAAFLLPDGVAVRGGYAGAGAADPDERDIARHPTVLSGDLAGDDGPAFSGKAENSYHVVATAVAADMATTSEVLDGFSITGGNADGEAGDGSGGGMELRSEALVIDCAFSGNFALTGGAIVCGPSAGRVTYPALTRCAISGNRAEADGGAMWIGDSDPKITSCRIRGNAAGQDGGGIAFGNDNCTALVDCIIDDNSAGRNGGGTHNVFCFNWKMENCTVAGNQAASGGGMYLEYDCEVTITNCIFWGDAPDEIVTDRVGPPAIGYCAVQGGWGDPGQVGILVADPRFVDAANGDLRLSEGSPCIDAGAATDIAFDIEQNPRLCGAAVDLGAYETCPLVTPFARGDANADAAVDLSDAVAMLGFLFLSWQMNDCLKAADVNDDGKNDIADPVALLGYLFLDVGQPHAPYAACGRDPTPDALGCAAFAACQ